MSNRTKARLIAGDRRLIMPRTWKELNPKMARLSEYIVICSDNTSNTAVWYSAVPANELSDKEADDIIWLAQNMGLNESTHIYGFIMQEEFNHSGAKIVGN